MQSNFIELHERESGLPVCVYTGAVTTINKPGEACDYCRIHILGEKYCVDVKESYEEVVVLLNPAKVHQPELTSESVLSSESVINRMAGLAYT